MQTLKTALVVVVLLVVLFVAYRALNNQPIGLPLDLGANAPGAPQGVVEVPNGVNVEAPPLSSWDAGQGLASPTGDMGNVPNMPASMPLGDGDAVAVSPGSIQGETSAGVAPPLATGHARASHSTYEHDHNHGATVSPAVALAESEDRPASQAAQPPAEAARDYAASAEISSGSLPGRPAPPAAAPPSSAEESPSRYDSPAIAKYALEQAWQKADYEIAEGKLARALLTLTEFYRHPDLDDESQAQLNERLDQLAGTVIYSTRHLLEDPYKVLRGETLEEIVARYNAPERLIRNINGLGQSDVVTPGMELKLLRGPLRAEIDLHRGELTMFLGGLYAGRFPIEVGAVPAPQAGQYAVRDVQPGRTYYSPSGQVIPTDNPSNPYGQWWLDLGGDVCIHGRPASGDASAGGCISLSPRDAADVAAILSVGSKVVIR